MTYSCPYSELAKDTHLLKLQRLQNKGCWKFSKVHNGPRFTQGFQPHTHTHTSVCVCVCVCVYIYIFQARKWED
jgi:hypothetical protein